MSTPVGKPEITKGVGSYGFWFPDVRVRAIVSRLREEGTGEAAFYHENGTGKLLLHRCGANFLSTQALATLERRLQRNIAIDWDTVLTYVANHVLEDMRKGEPFLLIGKKPESMAIEYQLEPILEKGQPTTFFAPGGTAKSYLGAAIGVSVQCGVKLLGWMPTQGNVLYLDWEATEKDHERRLWAIKKGLGAEDGTLVAYRRCNQPLTSDIYTIQEYVSEHKISLVIVDSYTAAAGYGQDAAQVASQYYNALRSLGCTTLTIDHVTKHAPLGVEDTPGPIGTVVKYNRSRAQYELKKSQEPGDDFIEVVLKHQKHNEGKLFPPLGIRMEFMNGEDGHLDHVKFLRFDITENPKLASSASVWQQIKAQLKHEPMTIPELVTATGGKYETIKAELHRKSKLKPPLVMQIDPESKKWGLTTHGLE